MIGLLDTELREEARLIRQAHDPAYQGHPYQRCALCGYTHHPCDTYLMADAVLLLLDRVEGSRT